jgi:15-cis-phytoene synthase
MTTALQPVDGALSEAPSIAARAIIRRHSKSFSLASLLLGGKVQRDAHALYAYCRRADDAIDLVPPEQTRSALERLRLELDAVYAGRILADPIARELQRLVFDLRIPREYPEALLEGFELDVEVQTYESLPALYHYCWCVAGSVGAMMCHVLGARQDRALVHAAHLGMGLQLTNICRDVAEDWARGRLYLPLELLPGWQPPTEFPPSAAQRARLGAAITRLLSEADAFYRSGDAGLRYLPFRSRLAVATARRVYSSIGRGVLAQGADVTAGRVVVPRARKLWCVARAVVDATLTRAAAMPVQQSALRVLRFPGDVLPG